MSADEHAAAPNNDASEIDVVVVNAETQEHEHPARPTNATHIPDGVPVLQWRQLLCHDHFSAAVDGWWPFVSNLLPDIALMCSDCENAMRPHLPVDSQGHFRVIVAGPRPKWSLQDRLYLTAIHEAGHAVVGMAGGMKLNHIIVPADDVSGPGLCHWKCGTYRLLTWLAQTWAGITAERQWVIENHSADPDVLAGITTSNAAELLRIDQVTSYYRVDQDSGLAEARHSIANLWSDIVAVANHLQHNGETDAETVVSLINLGSPTQTGSP